MAAQASGTLLMSEVAWFVMFAWFMMFGMSYENLPRMGIMAAQASGIPLIGGAGGRGGRGRRTWCLQAYPLGAQRALTVALLAEPRQGWEADATV